MTWLMKSTYNRHLDTPKLRYLVGPLLYLLPRQELSSLYPKLETRPGIYLLAKTMAAVATRDVSDILHMGVNATHSAARLLK